MHKSAYFTWDEVTRSAKADELGIANEPDTEEQRRNIHATMHDMDTVRWLLGQPIIPSSFFRNAAVNKAAGGRVNSRHARGLAMDWSSPKFGSVRQCWEKVKQNADLIGFHKNILETRKEDGVQWVHLSFPAAGEEPLKQSFEMDAD